MLIGLTAFLLIVIDLTRFTLASPIVAIRSNDSVRSVKESVFEGQVTSVLPVGISRSGMRGAQNDYAAPMSNIRVDDKVKDDESDEKWAEIVNIERRGSLHEVASEECPTCAYGR